MLHLVKEQAYKLVLPKNWKIYDVFYVLLLEQNTTRKGRVDKNATQLEFEPNNNEKYKVKDIRDSTINSKALETGHLPELYYLIS